MVSFQAFAAKPAHLLTTRTWLVHPGDRNARYCCSERQLWAQKAQLTWEVQKDEALLVWLLKSVVPAESIQSSHQPFFHICLANRQQQTSFRLVQCVVTIDFKDTDTDPLPTEEACSLLYENVTKPSICHAIHSDDRKVSAPHHLQAGSLAEQYH